MIFLTFKDVKYSTWEATYEKICKLISAEFRRHNELATSSALSLYEKELFAQIANGNAKTVDFEAALESLSLMLHKHHNNTAIIMFCISPTRNS